ncbi:hypothetical protein FIU50_03825, partial [Enterococcus faecium]
LSQNVVHSDSDLILHNSSVLIDKEPFILQKGLPFLYGFFHLHKIFYTLLKHYFCNIKNILLIIKLITFYIVTNLVFKKNK